MPLEKKLRTVPHLKALTSGLELSSEHGHDRTFIHHCSLLRATHFASLTDQVEFIVKVAEHWCYFHTFQKFIMVFKVLRLCISIYQEIWFSYIEPCFLPRPYLSIFSFNTSTENQVLETEHWNNLLIHQRWKKTKCFLRIFRVNESFFERATKLLLLKNWYGKVVFVFWFCLF